MMRVRFGLLTAVAVGALTFTAAPTFAAGSGMPQFDFATAPKQLFWLVVSFGVLWFVMASVVLPRLADTLEARQSRIAHDLAKAEAAKAESEAAREAYEQVLAEARATAQGILREAQAKLAADQEAKLGALREKLDADLKAAEARITTARTKALAEVEGVAAEVASAAVAKLIGAAPAADVVNKAVQDSKEQQA